MAIYHSVNFKGCKHCCIRDTVFLVLEEQDYTCSLLFVTKGYGLKAHVISF